MTDESKETEEQTQAPEPPQYLDEDGKPIPLYDNRKTEIEEKKGFKLNLASFLGILAVLLLIASLTPVYSWIMRLTPDSWQSALLKPVYQNTPLTEGQQKYDQPMKFPIPQPGRLRVLGFDTGICFSFPSTSKAPDPDHLSAEQIEGAKDGNPIAEIIAIGTIDKYEYSLKQTSYTETLDKDENEISIICQKFGRNYGSPPLSINALYIRPLQPFTAKKTVWKSIKHLYDDYTSPLNLEGGSPQPTLLGQ